MYGFFTSYNFSDSSEEAISIVKIDPFPLSVTRLYESQRLNYKFENMAWSLKKITT